MHPRYVFSACLRPLDQHRSRSAGYSFSVRPRTRRPRTRRLRCRGKPARSSTRRSLRYNSLQRLCNGKCNNSLFSPSVPPPSSSSSSSSSSSLLSPVSVSISPSSSSSSSSSLSPSHPPPMSSSHRRKTIRNGDVTVIAQKTRRPLLLLRRCYRVANVLPTRVRGRERGVVAPRRAGPFVAAAAAPLLPCRAQP